MNTAVRSREDLADEWLSTGALSTLSDPAQAKSYPKRSELRRAEARAATRRSADRRPAGGRPAGPAGTQRPAGPSEASRRPHAQGFGPARIPFAVSPTPAVLPIRQTATSARPAGIDLPRQTQVTSFDAFHKPVPDVVPMVPIAVPAAAPMPPTAPPDLAAPLAPSLDPAAWGLDLDPVPVTGRRRGAEEPETARRRLAPAPGVPLPARLIGKGRSGAARLLVLALVVGAEGVAVTSMAGPAHHTLSAEPAVAGIAGAFDYSAAADKAEAAASTAALPAAVHSAPALPAIIDPQSSQAFVAAQQASSKAMVAAALAQAKAAAARVKAAADRRAAAMRTSQRDPKGMARVLLADRGWGAGQMSCLVSLWNRESMWNYRAYNPSSGAYGIPQALPGSKMASAGADWRTNPVTQIKWGLSYIAGRYGTPCGAWGHSEATGWY